MAARRLSLPALPALVTSIALAFTAGGARAATVDLSWDACNSGVVDRVATEPGVYTIALTGRSLAGRVIGTHFAFELRSPGGLPQAWRFDAAGCNAGALDFQTSTATKACPSIGGLPSTSVRFEMDPGGLTGILTIDVLYFGPLELFPLSTYSLGRVRLDFSNTGCDDLDRPVCVALVEASLVPQGSSTEQFERGQAFVRWNDQADETICSGQSSKGFHIDEFMTTCATYDHASHFLELASPPGGGTLGAALSLRTESATGAVLLDEVVVPVPPSGLSWPSESGWLVSTESFENASRLRADHRVEEFLDPAGGRIVLRDTRPGGPVLQDLRYGPGEAIPAPLPRQSIVHSPTTGYVVSATPSPRNFVGATSPGIVCRPTTADRFVIREIAAACFSLSTAGQFIEVESLDDSVWTGQLILDVLDAFGNVLAQRPGLFNTSPSPSVPGRTSWLVATSGFQAITGVAPDQTWNGFAASQARLLRIRSPLYGVLYQVPVNQPGAAAMPDPGQSVVFENDGSYRIQFPPDPRNSQGQTIIVSECFPADTTWAGRFSGVRIAEISTQCEFADERVFFFELEAGDVDQEFDRNARIEVFDSADNLLLSKLDLFSPQADGSTWPAGRSWLFGSADIAGVHGVVPDATAPRLDPVGGFIRFYDQRLPVRIIDEVRYGPGGTIAAPPPGSSIRRAPDGTASIAAPPEPRNFAGDSGHEPNCPCPLAEFRWEGMPRRKVDLASFDSTSAGGFYRIVFDRRSPMIRIDLNTLTFGAEALLADRFVIPGSPSGQELQIYAQFRAVGSAGGACYPVHGCNSGGGGLIWASEDSSGGFGWGGTINREFLVPVQVRTGQPFYFRWGLSAGTNGISEVVGADYTVTMRWVNVPVGLHVESCAGYVDEGPPVATRPALVTSVAEPGRVLLEWSPFATEVSNLVVERRGMDSEWTFLGTPEADRTRIAFEDRTIEPGARYGYRLRWHAGGTAETSEEVWLWVPAPPFTARLASGPVVRGPIELALTLPTGEDVEIEVFDLRGRRVEEVLWQPRAAGPLTYELQTAHPLAPGVYWIRLRQQSERATLKAIVLGNAR